MGGILAWWALRRTPPKTEDHPQVSNSVLPPPTTTASPSPAVFDVAAGKAAIQAARIKATTDAEKARVEALEKAASALTGSTPIFDYAVTRFTGELRSLAKENGDEVVSDYRASAFYVLPTGNQDPEATIKLRRNTSWTFRVTFQQRSDVPKQFPNPLRLVILSTPKLSTDMPTADILRFELKSLPNSELQTEVFVYGDQIPPEGITPNDFKGPINKTLSMFVAAQLERFPLSPEPTRP